MSSLAIRVILSLGLLVLLSLLLPGISSWDPLLFSIENRLHAPSNLHLLGTDDLGRDVLSRILHGVRLTVSISVIALITSLFIGVLFGAVAGYFYGQWPDKAFGWFADLLTAVPFLVLIAAVLSLTGPGIVKAYLVLAGVIWVGPARIVRAEVIRTMQLEYVQAERAIGTSELKIVMFSVLPTCIEAAVIYSAGYLPEVIALEAGLSFLGLGVQPPDPGLGKMIFDGISYMTSAWWVAASPAIMLFILVLFVQLVAWVGKTEYSR